MNKVGDKQCGWQSVYSVNFLIWCEPLPLQMFSIVPSLWKLTLTDVPKCAQLSIS